MKKKFTSLVLALVMCMTLCVPVFANEYSSTPGELGNLSQETVLTIGGELTANGSSVKEEMTNLIATYRSMQ